MRVVRGLARPFLSVAVWSLCLFRGTASPEYGGNIGSVTSIVTKSSGADFQGAAYEFFRNDVSDTRNYFSQTVEPLKQNQYGFTVGRWVSSSGVLPYPTKATAPMVP
jgi:hypothetical protein